MNLEKLRDDFVQITARLILHKDRIARGQLNPNTDDWGKLYAGNDFSSPKAYDTHQTIVYNRFRAEVDGTVAMMMRSVANNRE